MFRKLFLASILLASPAFASEELWKAKCKSCHGDTGAADTKNGQKYEIGDLRTAEWQAKHSDEEIRKVIAEGVPDTKMKPYADKLSAEEIDALVKHIRGLKQ